MIEIETTEDCTLYAVASRNVHNKPTYDAGTAAKCLYCPLSNHVETDSNGEDVIIDGMLILRPGETISEEYRIKYDGKYYYIVRLDIGRAPGQLYTHHYELYLKRTK